MHLVKHTQPFTSSTLNGFLFSLLNMSLKDRMERIKTELGVNWSQLAALAEMTKSGMSLIKSGATQTIKAAHAIALQNKTGFRVEWIADGQGPERAVSEVSGNGEVGTTSQLIADWKTLPPDWQYYICHKARELAEAANGLPEIVKQSMRPIKNEDAYRDWEARIDSALRDGELLNFTLEMRKAGYIEAVGGSGRTATRKTGSNDR